MSMSPENKLKERFLKIVREKLVEIEDRSKRYNIYLTGITEDGG